MNTLNPLFGVVIFLTAFGTAYILKLTYKVNNLPGRYETIDGLRGFLALGVFIHHACIWYPYVQTGIWEEPRSYLYSHLGQTSVSFFFMITSFLFISKLLNAGKKGFNWRSFFISRIFRLAPMYYFSILILFLFVMITGNWELKVSTSEFLKSIFDWGVFTVTGSTPLMINKSALTGIINASVIWSLPFEWLFYFSLPLISLLLVKRKPSAFYIAISMLFVLAFAIAHGLKMNHLLSFAGGAVAPFIIKYASPKFKVNNFISSIIVLTCLFLIGLFNTADNLVCKALISIIFTFIALGNTLFGILKNATLKFLGEISYSTYLLHGIILFSVLYFGIGIERTKQFSPLVYCMVIFSVTPVVVIISFLGYKLIEKPFMDRSIKINDSINSSSAPASVATGSS